MKETFFETRAVMLYMYYNASKYISRARHEIDDKGKIFPDKKKAESEHHAKHIKKFIVTRRPYAQHKNFY